MRRLLMILSLVLVAFVAANHAEAKLSRGEQSKMRKFLAEYLSRSLSPEKRDAAAAAVADFFAAKRKAKELKGVEQLADLLSNCAIRQGQRPGVSEKTLDFEGTKYGYAVSIPKKYSGNLNSDGWPMIICIPDKGEGPTEYLDKYWKDEAVRANYILIVIGYDYGDIVVEKTEEKVDEDGKVTLETVKEKVPFSWDAKPAENRFWGVLSRAMMVEYKVDPNRVILDGTGLGADGALKFGVGAAWRFGGLILRGGAVAGPVIQNLANLPVLALPGGPDSETSKKAHEEVKAAVGDKYVTAGGEGWTPESLMLWLGAAKRNRYVLPSKWVATLPAHQFGYWFFISRPFDKEKPSTLTISSDLKKKRVDLVSENVQDVTLYLNDLIVDLDKPFDIYVNGEKLMAGVTAERSAAQFLAHLKTDAPVDPGAVFTAQIAVTKISPPEEEEEEEEEEGEKKDSEDK